ncbi:DUF2934 domain-containing protein [Pseudomonas alliivorans]|nr:DUF2934 domain-containing protein [Pseudomonas alliivorans]
MGLEYLSDRRGIEMVEEDEIRKKAYELWEADGREGGGNLLPAEYWHRAREQLEAQHKSPGADMLDATEGIEPDAAMPER